MIKNFKALDEIQEAFKASEQRTLDNINPTCKGIGTQTYIERDVAAKTIVQFCASNRSGSRATAQASGGSDSMYLTITFDGEFTVSKDQCKILFYSILDSCDGDSPDNPANFKHGGSLKYAPKATLTVDPKSGSNPYCNSGHSNKRVDLNVGVDAITRFCRDTSFGGTKGERHAVTYNKGQSSEVAISLAFTQDRTGLDYNTCVNQ